MILALETSTPRASLAVYAEETETLEWETAFETDRSHNSVIFGPVTEALERFGGDLARVAVGVGPGSYSGVRVAIAVANGLALSRGLSLQPVSSLEAYGEAGESCFVVGDARRKTFFLAELASGALAGAPELVSAADLETRLREVGDDVPVYSPDEGVVTRFSSIRLAFPSAATVARRAALSALDSCGNTPPLEPHYLRAPYITTPKGR